FAARETKPAREKQGETKRQSLEMFRLGNTIAEIAALRNLSLGTIEGHLAHAVYTGELEISALVESANYETIREAITKTGGGIAASPVKAMLGEAVTYG